MDRVVKLSAAIKRLLVLSMVLVSVALNANVSAGEGDWQLEKEKDGVKIYARSVEGWEIREIRAVSTVSAGVGSIVAVLNDVENSAPKLSDVVRHSTIAHRDSDTQFRIYSVLDMPWPLSDRDSLNQRVVQLDAESGVVTITDTATQGIMPEKEDLVRIVDSRQQWTLTPISNTETQVQLQVLVDPNGPIPSSVINSMSIGQPIGTLTTLKELVKEPQYRDAELAASLATRARETSTQ